MPMLGYKELYEARERLRNPRARTDLDCVTNVTQTWERYLADVGIAYRSDLMPNGSRLTCDIPLSKRYQIATQTHEEALQSILQGKATNYTSLYVQASTSVL